MEVGVHRFQFDDGVVGRIEFSRRGKLRRLLQPRAVA